MSAPGRPPGRPMMTAHRCGGGTSTSEEKHMMRRTRRIGMLIAAAVPLVVVTAVLAAPAHANDPGTISNRRAQLCLQPWPDAGTPINSNGVRVAQVGCTGGDQQLWLPVQVGRTNVADRIVK